SKECVSLKFSFPDVSKVLSCNVSTGRVQQPCRQSRAEKQTQPRQLTIPKIAFRAHRVENAREFRSANQLLRNCEYSGQAKNEEQRTPHVCEHGREQRSEAEENRSRN